MVPKIISLCGCDNTVSAAALVALAQKDERIELAYNLWSPQYTKVYGSPPASVADVVALQKVAKEAEVPVRVCLHVGGDWFRQMMRGEVPKRLLALLMMRNFDGSPLVQRIQLNMYVPFGLLQPPENGLAALCKELRELNPDIQLILPWAQSYVTYISTAVMTENVAVLMDLSRGQGRLPDVWALPTCQTCMVGFAGGLSPENIGDQLPKIQQLVGCAPFWLDATSGLRDENDCFSKARAEAFVSAIQAAETVKLSDMEKHEVASLLAATASGTVRDAVQHLDAEKPDALDQCRFLLRAVAYAQQEKQVLNLALALEGSLVAMLCSGRLPPFLEPLIEAKNFDGSPVVTWVNLPQVDAFEALGVVQALPGIFCAIGNVSVA